jgi:AraC-like DNA-binding protein
VRSALVPRSRQPVAFPGIDAVAERFHMTPQTLRRRLKREGASFVSIREDIRRDIAIQKVLKGESRIEDIAHVVGYAETRCFTRAFRQWTGFSPLQYRERFLQAAEKFGRLE